MAAYVSSPEMKMLHTQVNAPHSFFLPACFPRTTRNTYWMLPDIDLEGPTEIPHPFFFPVPPPSFPSFLRGQSVTGWAEGDGWVAPLCCTAAPMGAPLGTSGVPRGGEQRDAGPTVSLAPFLPPQEIFVSYQLIFSLPVWECRSH